MRVGASSLGTKVREGCRGGSLRRLASAITAGWRDICHVIDPERVCFVFIVTSQLGKKDVREGRSMA